jgi:cytoskeletal protein CcmA (bactofilin family)
MGNQEPCIIGQGITINGRLTGDEDLIIEGWVEGTISLNNHLIVE